jgi:deoxyadenosine/deoxycytidine kinase
MPRSIIIEGLIASGKTTIAKELSEALGPNTLLLLEPADGETNYNPYMSDYYDDPLGYSFKIQIFLLATRYGYHKYAQSHVVSGKGDAVLDRSLYGDVSFANVQRRMNLMDERDFETYRRHYRLMTMEVSYPNFCIRLLVSPETSLRRIQQRIGERDGRKCESGIDIGYLRMLDEEIGNTTAFLRSQGVVVLDVPWDTEREDPEARRIAVAALKERILSLQPHDPFQRLHTRTM